MSSASFRAALKSQYNAALRSLQQTIESCPEALWVDRTYTNPYWLVAYHTLFFTHLYLMQKEADFRPWAKHRPGYQAMDAGAKDKPPYSREELLEYCRYCIELIDPAVDSLDLDHPESGFSWYPVPKLEHQIVNIRHLQHHAGQLADRLRQVEQIGTAWIGKGRPEP